MKPSESEYIQALSQARRQRDEGDDPHFMAKALLYQAHRLEALEKVVQAAELYMRFGQGEHEHAALLRALEQARRVADLESGKAEEDLGLG